MKIGILCAGDTEVVPFLRMMKHCKATKKSMLTFYQGQLEDIEVVALFSGVCKVNAAIAAQILIDTYGCTVIINAGTAGGIDEKLEIFDTVISTETAYHDVADDILTEFHPWKDSIYFKADEKLLEAVKTVIAKGNLNNRVFLGRMITGEQFIENNKREYIAAKYSPLSVDMETASIAHVCYVNGIPFISIRTITDTPDRSGISEFEKNCKKASQISANLVKSMLKEL
ncbi:5'-methylthioadenosine/adenosylhomocysteine nucleosidase [Ihubacter massiliensis]|uniref:adenosylhomocysteine nucleosidase n=1 Tax=Hominibacterium faecale TaxID=2839743 RepID=A0A9J6QRM9_9FIRM|nr:5'-methylthioadenosine/adenosylhomocysteine nucleosidase [Hominibacterium faecale]MCO7121152.1 5'-methylthioadenosine/adenosylhomocysteine nucleosidase [Ihubacter massiliensis]MCU7378068.1 5'-methylthioadenosine/adenosylhomocysteine nucleosidase [Hominibacterium faecale]